jgi:hypothetical protein
MKRLYGCLLFAASMTAWAEVVQITAEFEPDPAKPHSNEFKNTTKDSGYCAENPFSCQEGNGFERLFSIETGIDVQSIRPIPAHHTNPRQGAMFDISAAQWRDVTVLDARGNPATVQVRIAGVGGRYRLSHRVQEIIGREDLPAPSAHSRLWDILDWGIAPRPCREGRAGAGVNDTDFAFLWLTPVPGVCQARANFEIPALSYPRLNFAYAVRTPDPLKMAPGVYTGNILYRLGPGADFDMGDNMQATPDSLQLVFTLTVNHVLAVEIPPGGNEVQLVPAGGWQAWLQQGRKPNRLLRDQTFNIWTSTPFKMQLSCVIDLGNTCGLQDAVGNRVPVNVAVSLPYGLTRNGQSVERQPLRLDGQGTERFEPNLYVARKPGTLHFSVEQDGVRQMLDLGSAKFSGDVTVVWDSEV